MTEAAESGIWRDSAPVYPCLAGKRVMVTGGGSGIGAGMVAAFARQGCEVGFLSRGAANAAAVAAALAAHGKTATFHSCDVRDIDALRATLDAFGPLDILINNAADDRRYGLATMTPAEWDDAMAINLRHLFFAIQAVVPGMKARGGGAIVNIGSNSAIAGWPGLPDYVAAKGAIATMSRSLARELGPSNIRVNTLVPGWVLTDRQLREVGTPEAQAQNITTLSIKRVMTVTDIVEPAVFLASSAAAMMTAQQMVVDGGRV
jgi:D-xylose 1-dehydrogenase